MLSFWEKQSFLSYDYVIIGSGIVGLSTAAAIAEKKKKAKILILERGLFPTGASTKNAGFACFGSLTEILADIEKTSENEVLSLIENRYGGLKRLRKRLGDKAMDFQQLGGYELISEQDLPALEYLESINQSLQFLFKEPPYVLKNKLISNFGFDKNTVKALVMNPYEGQIDTGKMMKSFLTYVQEFGVTVLNQCEVSSFEEAEGRVKIYVKDNLAQEIVGFSAKKLIICTNAFTKNFFPELDVQPGRGQVLITSPIKKLKFEGTFHLDQGYFYFRNFEDRVLFGGGRNLDFEGENTTKMETTSLIMNTLESKLANIILPNQKFSIEHRWAGIMAFGQAKKPIIQFVSPNILLAVRMGGMGVAIGSNVGEEASELVIN